MPEPHAVAARLLAWSRNHGRDFPWRHWKDPYRLLVTEVLLRQTRAVTVAVYVERFFRIYPDAPTLAAASEEELAGELRSLGFSRQRAKQLRALADRLSDDARRVQLDSASLAELPGIGRYSAGIVAAIAGECAPAVDTNVARVISRVFGIRPSHSEARKSTNIWRMAYELIEASGQPARLTWSVIDLSAALCRPQAPLCEMCTLSAVCESSSMRAGDRRGRG
jgi:A/G-specific adenine glycosylase